MIDIQDLTKQVIANCEISDARHAGLFSICGLALRLRDLYKWEMRLPPWQEKDTSEILEWIETKENKWESLLETDYHGIAINGDTFEPFDTEGINARLEPLGLHYGAGYARSLKPTFLLARIESREEINGHRVYTLEKELARDLLTIPALNQGDCVIFRREAARMFFWDQMSYLNKSGKPALKYALEQCGLKYGDTEALRQNLDRLLAVQSQTYIFHEIGEMDESAFPRDLWREIIAAFPHTLVEFAARTVKDLLADTGRSGTLRHLLRQRDAAAFGFYAAFIDGLGKAFFPELRTAFATFSAAGDWDVLDRAVSAGFASAKNRAENMIEIYHEGKRIDDLKWAEKEIQEKLLCDVIK